MSNLSVNTITNAAGGNTAQINGMTPTADSLQGFRNRILNGGMVIDQRNAGASVTPTDGQYTLDRWKLDVSQTSKLTVQQNAGAVTPPVGFTNYLGVTSSSAYSVLSGDYFALRQIIEGFNSADLAWGTASAQSVTLSFWVRSSLTGTFGGSLRNSAGNRSYPFTYSVSAANTWEQKTVTITGDTTGTWLTTNGTGINVWFGLGVGSLYSGTASAWNANNNFSATGAVSVVGTSGATFYITGVQLEAGSVATPFERRPYGTELALCQRYAIQLVNTNPEWIAGGYAWVTTSAFTTVQLPVVMRSSSQTLTVSNAAHFAALTGGASVVTATIVALDRVSARSPNIQITVASGLTVGQGSALYANNASASLVLSAEL